MITNILYTMNSRKGKHFKASKSRSQVKNPEGTGDFCKNKPDTCNDYIPSSSHEKNQIVQTPCSVLEKNDNSLNHYHDWNPMEGMANSLLNSSDNGGCTIQRLLTGIEHIKQEDVLCPFNDGSGKCYKQVCHFKHVPYSSNDLNERPKLYAAVQSKREPLWTVESLPSQILPATGCISKAVVATVLDPWTFYLVPENAWKCLCSTIQDQDELKRELVTDFKDSRFSMNFYNTLNNFHINMSKFQRESKFRKTNEFLCGELVAVKLQTVDEHKAWYRAKVLADAIEYSDKEEDLFKPVDVPIELLDYGSICVRSSADIFALPADFVSVPPMAYKCQLFGVSPVMGSWSRSSIKRFQELLKGQNVLVEVNRTAFPSTTTTCKMDGNHCWVTIYVQTEDGDYVDVAQDLINSGFGIKWNL